MISSYIVEHAQIDGRRWVNETHKDDLGFEYPYSYLSDDKIDRDAILLVHATQITAYLAEKAVSDQATLALDAKLKIVLDDAKVSGKLTQDEIIKLGLAPITEAVAVVTVPVK